MRLNAVLANSEGLAPEFPVAKSSGPTILVKGIASADGGVSDVAALRSSKYAIPAKTDIATPINKTLARRSLTIIVCPVSTDTNGCDRISTPQKDSWIPKASAMLSLRALDVPRWIAR